MVDGQFWIINATVLGTSSRPTSLFTRTLESTPLDPNDIATLEVIKAPIAQKRFGTRPGVPVLVITTKPHTWHRLPPRRDR